MDLRDKPFRLVDHPDIAEVAGDLDTYLDDAKDVLNSKISSDTVYSTLTPDIADVEFQIIHGLGRIPTKYILVGTDKAGQLYKGPRAWDTSAAFFKFSSAFANVEVLIW